MSGTAVARHPSTGRTDIELILSDGRSIRRAVWSHDTLGGLVNDLRDGGHLMGVSAIRVGSGDSLLTSDDWRHLTMAQIGVESGRTLHITTFRPMALRVFKFRPEKKWSEDSRTVPISGSDAVSLNAIETRLRELSFDPMAESALTYQELSVYTLARRPRRAVKSFDKRTRKYLYVDEVSGGEELDDQRSHLILSFLSSGSGPIAAASSSHIPVLNINLNSQVLTVDDNGQLQPEFTKSLLYPDDILLLRGLRFSDRHHATLAMMLKMRGGGHLDISTGDVYADADTAVASVGEDQGRWSRALILVGPSSLLPQYKIPAGVIVEAYRRSGWEVSVHGRRIRGQPTDRADSGSVWVTPFDEREFDRQLTRAMTQP